MASTLIIPALCFFLCLTVSSSTQDVAYMSFLKCMSHHTPPNTNISDLIYTPNNPRYSSLLESSLQNLRFTSAATPKPLLIITPTNENHVQASVLCCKNQSLQIRVRSGGHDYEGLSYRSTKASRFAVLDLANLRSVHVDSENRVAWVEGGATLGELFYSIAEKSELLGFPAGICPTVGVGGHFSGGGFGNLMRKYGLAADHIIDAKLVDVNGRILDRDSMGEDLFWAIRGGGAESFGVIVSWKVRLVPVPSTVSYLRVSKTLELDALYLVNKWQYIAPNLHEDLHLSLHLQQVQTGEKREVSAVFASSYLGDCKGMLQMLQESFPELGPRRSECREMGWIQSVLYVYGYRNGEPLEVLLDRALQPKVFNKGKSDYLVSPMPTAGWRTIWKNLMKDGAAEVNLNPHGGRMNEIPESATPYPHRNGTLCVIQYLLQWEEGGFEATDEHLEWIRGLHRETSPYVSKNPRGAYVNFRDLDLGMNEETEKNMTSSYLKAEVWGRKYFKNNFRRLARVKAEVDPENFFRNEQSIPPLFEGKQSRGEALISSL